MEGITGQSQTAPALVAVRQEIDDWRQQKKRTSEAMPAVLWQAAVRLATERSVREVSRGLGVDYGKLRRLVKERVASQSATSLAIPREADTTPEFVELNGLFSGCQTAVVELHRDGARIRVELPAAQVDLVGMATSFFLGSA